MKKIALNNLIAFCGLFVLNLFCQAQGNTFKNSYLEQYSGADQLLIKCTFKDVAITGPWIGKGFPPEISFSKKNRRDLSVYVDSAGYLYIVENFRNKNKRIIHYPSYIYGGVKFDFRHISLMYTDTSDSFKDYRKMASDLLLEPEKKATIYSLDIATMLNSSIGQESKVCSSQYCVSVSITEYSATDSNVKLSSNAENKISLSAVREAINNKLALNSIPATENISMYTFVYNLSCSKPSTLKSNLVKEIS